MKYEKERRFVKEVNEALEQEVIVSRIEILEVNKSEDKIIRVVYRDRFGRKAYVQFIDGEYSKYLYDN